MQKPPLGAVFFRPDAWGSGLGWYAFREPILRKELRRDRGRGYETTLADATGFDAGRQL